MMRRILLGFFMALGCFAAHAQSAPLAYPPEYVVPGAQITLCGNPANGFPCTNYAVSYTDATLTTQCPQTAPVTLNGSSSCSSYSGPDGSVGFWVANGCYTYFAFDSSTNNTIGPVPFCTGSGAGGTGNTTSNNLTPGTLPLAQGPMSLGNSSATDNGSLFAYAGPSGIQVAPAACYSWAADAFLCSSSGGNVTLGTTAAGTDGNLNLNTLNAFTVAVTNQLNVTNGAEFTGNTDIDGTFTLNGNPGTLNQVFASQGPGAVPQWINQAGGTSTICTGTQAVSVTAIASGAKSALQTISCPGLLATDSTKLDFSGDPTSTVGFVPSTAGMLTIIPWPSAGQINFYEVNNTASSITPGALSVVYRGFR